MSKGADEMKLEFETPQFLHGLFANEPKELNYLKEKLGVSIVTRDGWILLRGDANKLAQAKKAFLDLEATSRGGYVISTKEFRVAVDLAVKGAQHRVAEMKKLKLLGRGGRKPVVAKSPQQAVYLREMQVNDLIFGLGAAGTGKTYLAMAMALHMLVNKQVNRIILTRPAVEAGEALGFLPGDLQEKVAPYLRPLYDAMHDMLDADKGKRLMEDGTIEIAPLAYMRGRTLSNAFIILDEAQNTTTEQMLMLLTRIGEGSKCVVTGDGSQVDLKKGVGSGLLEAQNILKEVEGVSFVHFDHSEVVRHEIVSKIISAYDKHRQL